MMITIYDSTMKKYTYFDRIKRPEISLKFVVNTETTNVANSTNTVKFTCSTSLTNPTSFTYPTSFVNSANSTNSTCPTSPVNSTSFTYPTSSVNSTNSTNSTCSASSTSPTNSVHSVFPTNSTSSVPSNDKLQYLRKLYVLEHYNKEMSDLDNHVKLNSYNSVNRHYHQRNWLSLFYLLIDAVITNVYILYKLDNKDKLFLHTQFQEQITQNLLRGLKVILRQRRPHPSQVIYNLYTRPVPKDSYKRHS